MSPNVTTDRSAEMWNVPDYCPFCGAKLSDGGQGFIDHIEETPGCDKRFSEWLVQIRDDIGGEWAG